jgi:hypothetical protein
MMFAATSATSGLLVAEVIAGLLFAALGYWLSERYRRNWGRSPWGLPSLLWAFIFFLSLLVGAILFLIAQRTTRSTTAVTPGQSPPWYPPAAPGYGGYPPPSGAYPPPPGPYPGVPAGEQVPPAVGQPSPPRGVRPDLPDAGPSGSLSPANREKARPAGFPAPAGGGPASAGPAVPASAGPAHLPKGPQVPATAYAPPGRPPGYVSPDPGARPRTEASTADPVAAPEDASAGPSPAPAWLGDPTLRHELRYWNGSAWTDWVSDSGRTATDPYSPRKEPHTAPVHEDDK